MKEILSNREEGEENFKEKQLVDSFNFNENIVTEPKEGDLALCAKVVDKKSSENYEWALLPMQSQLGKEHRVVLFFDSKESDDFIKKTVNFLSKNYPKMEPGVFKIDMSAYKYWKEEPELSDVVFVKITPENFKEKWKIVGIDDFNFNKTEI